MATQFRPVTADDLLRMPSDMRCELVEGEIFEMIPTGRPHGRIASRFHGRLEQYLREHEYAFGEAYIAEFGFKVGTNPDTVLAPDVAFVTARREEEASDDEGFFPGAPDLALEVISPTDRYSEVTKVQKYLSAGARMVVVVDPPKRTMIVHLSHADVLILKEGDVFDGGDVVPGWRLQVRDLFSGKQNSTSTDRT